MVFTHREQWYSPTATAEREDEVRGSMQCQEIASTRRIRYDVDVGQRVTHGMRSMVAYVSQGYGVDSDQRIAQDIVRWWPMRRRGVWGQQWPIASLKVWYGVQRVAQGMVSSTRRKGMAPMVVNASLMV